MARPYDPYLNGPLKGVEKVTLDKPRRMWLPLISVLILGLAFVLVVVVILRDAQQYALSGQSYPPQDGPSIGVDKFDLMTVEAVSHKEEANAMMTVEASRAERAERYAEETRVAQFETATANGLAMQTAAALTPTATPIITDQLPNCEEIKRKAVENPQPVECAPYVAPTVAPTVVNFCEADDYGSDVTTLDSCYVMPPTPVPPVAEGVVPTSAPLPSPPSKPTATPAIPTPVPPHYQSGGGY